MVAISNALTYLQFSGDVAFLDTSTECSGTSLHMISFTRPPPALVLQATNTGVRRPGYEASVATIIRGGHSNKHLV